MAAVELYTSRFFGTPVAAFLGALKTFMPYFLDIPLRFLGNVAEEGQN